ncbi:MAG TPA: glutamate synthase large subunit [Dehalococcoidia bacterium]|nr:glutamate synthase large subunit [Dehalococcoidia bacterium]
MSERAPLYRPEQERDACGVGFVADIAGRPSHAILEMAIQCVTNLTHRGALDADAKTGDGAGVSFQIPRQFFAEVVRELGHGVVDPADLAVGMVFLPRNEDDAGRCKYRLAKAAGDRGLTVLGWRPVPVDDSVLGDQARRTQPRIEQILLRRPPGMDDAAYERTLFLVRKDAERWAREAGVNEFYVPSLSHRTIVYKGLLVAHQLNKFYLDLKDPRFETALAVFHQRYSTNTFPNWILAQPFRMLAHNGEINTLQGNRNWMRAREPELGSEVWGYDIEAVKPIIQEGFSDSASLDNALEALVLSGRDPLHAMMMLIPEAWENMPNMPRNQRDFYEYHACLSEPWDGPASVAFTDGVIVGATLDRNGLRPARYQITSDGLIVMGSEVGMLELDCGKIVEKGRLGPGQMIAVDTAKGALLKNDDIKNEVASRKPYGRWVREHLMHLDDYLKTCSIEVVRPEMNLTQQQAAFGYTREELQYVIRPMAQDGKEPVWSMGDDTALAVLEEVPRLLPNYFKQKFAQVTNPPIDPIREELVMSLDVYLGPRLSLFEETPEHARLLHVASPLMIDEEIDALKTLDNGVFKGAVLPALFTPTGPDALEPALRELCRKASEAIDAGANILVLSDRGVDATHAPIPMLLAVGAVHHHLIREGKRMRASIVCETGEARDVHQIATLIGYGASGVNPYLALETVSQLFFSGQLKDLDVHKALTNYEKAVDAGILKIMSKMGISTVSAYHGAQIFEAVGLSQEVMDLAFVGTPSRIGGIGLREIAEDVLRRHRKAFQPEDGVQLDVGGFIRYRKEGEYHGNNPEVVRALHHAVETRRYEDYRVYADMVNKRSPIALRDLLDFNSDRPPIPVEEVEPIESIMRRFATGAMSLGALSPEAHETIAIGMNRIGGKSNTGEGGEEAWRWWQKRNSDDANSRIKQVASGRFGVTPPYLAAAWELEIKMAQGSKPGEGGQLPGHKVSPYIATIRHTLPGTPLISPPPHHDIYSIEDLAQLIYDLKQVNPRARICVKLVAEEGVGTIAAGVAKGYADVIQISGHEGGTGASPLSSIKYAGLPWELGLAETQQVLVLNDLRSRVTVRVDGGFHTGRDVVVAAMLGADEYGFGTIALIAIGCQMARQCHLNTCPVGIASQREDLRAKFPGTPDNVVTFFSHVAQEVRELLASLGYRRLDEIIGRMDLLRQIERPERPRAKTLDLSPIITMAPDGKPIRALQERNDRVERTLDDQILEDAKEALEGRGSVRLCYKVRNTDRTVGTKLAGEIAYRYHEEGLPEGTIEINLEGSAGQSLGAFLHRGIRIILRGEANDYVGKGMGGGEIALLPPEGSPFESHENVIMGNTCLYGATGGMLFAAGRAGERFAVRNSGAKAVVEGVGDHGCEYMTEGVVVILGETGRNFGAGMSNGIAYVLDEKGDFPSKLNPELVAIKRVTGDQDIEMLTGLIKRHVQLTGSRRGREILENWERFQPLFWKVAPHTAMTEEGPQTIINRHIESVRAAIAMG